jgi:hypothetical protein
MGQTIEINRTALVGNTLVVDTDRSLAGQDGESYNGPESARRVVEHARRAAAFPARLALRIFEEIPGVDHVHVMSNVVTLRRPEGWSEETIDRARELISGFFRFYR